MRDRACGLAKVALGNEVGNPIIKNLSFQAKVLRKKSSHKKDINSRKVTKGETLNA
jgi:hypothetical protein